MATKNIRKLVLERLDASKNPPEPEVKEKKGKKPKKQKQRAANMPLDDARWEAFALQRALGATFANSYLAAGFMAKNNNTAASSAQNLARNPVVKDRINELSAQVKAKLANEEIAKQFDAGIAQIVEDGIQAYSADYSKYMERFFADIDERLRTREGRVKTLMARHAAIYKVLAERSVYPEHQDVPGGSTGIVVTSWKAIGMGRIKTHSVDIGLYQELREIEKTIAIELGQWTERQENTHKLVDERDIPDELLDAMIEKGKRAQAEMEEKKQLPASEQVIDVKEEIENEPETAELENSDEDPEQKD